MHYVHDHAPRSENDVTTETNKSVIDASVQWCSPTQKPD